MRQKPKVKLRRINLINRWKDRYKGDWVIFGLQIWWAGPEDFCYKLCFLGFDLQIWFKRIFK